MDLSDLARALPPATRSARSGSVSSISSKDSFISHASVETEEDYSFDCEPTGPPPGFEILRHRCKNPAIEAWGRDEPTGDGYTASAGQPFNIYRALLRHNNLFFQFAIRLSLESLIALYSIDKEFHYRLNRYSTSFIHDYAKYHAPVASYIFSWVLYPHLCITDPMFKPIDGRHWLARDVPSLRWLGAVLYRQKIVHNILTYLALEGHRVPKDTDATLMKFWILMEMRTSISRRTFLADKTIWTNDDILRFHLLTIKLDMRFSDPVLAVSASALTHLVLAQPSLRMLWFMVTGRKQPDIDVMELILLRTYNTAELNVHNNEWIYLESLNQLARSHWGALSHERWNVNGPRMDFAMDMVIDECIRRGIRAENYLFEMMLYGYTTPDGTANVAVPTVRRGDNKVTVPAQPWPLNSDIRKIQEAVINSARLDGIKVKNPFGHQVHSMDMLLWYQMIGQDIILNTNEEEEHSVEAFEFIERLQMMRNFGR